MHIASIALEPRRLRLVSPPPPPDRPSREEIDVALYSFVRGEPVEKEKEAKRYSAIMAELSSIRGEFREQVRDLKEEVKGVKARVSKLEDIMPSVPPRSLSPVAGIKSVKAQSDTGSHLLVEIERGVEVVLEKRETAEDAKTLRAMRGGAKKWVVKLAWYGLLGTLTIVAHALIRMFVKGSP